ncbi:MAG TPA: aquaporin [Bacteroidia bacterium]|nr:aquaporin [Bacteroidia bacterium]
MKRYLAEFAGTFVMVFCGTGAIVLNQHLNHTLGGAGISIAFGVSVTLMILLFGGISGAHINPAVSVAVVLTGSLPRKQLIPYIISQFAGAVAASVILKQLAGQGSGLGATHPSGTLTESFLFEILLTFILMGVILLTAGRPSKLNRFAPWCIGLTVLLEAYFAGPVSGASMNPARSFGPAMVTGANGDLWLYLIAPVAGAVLAAFLWKRLLNRL